MNNYGEGENLTETERVGMRRDETLTNGIKGISSPISSPNHKTLLTSNFLSLKLVNPKT